MFGSLDHIAIGDSNKPFDVGDVLRDELTAIRARRSMLAGGTSSVAAATSPLTHDIVAAEDKLARYRSEAHELGNISALCLSGGGIRSAAFALGIMQGLAARGLLKKFDYLSTVSGGGYIGGLVTAWVQRQGYQGVSNELAGKQTGSKSPLRYLRRYSNYLTPRTGLVSADFVSVVLLYLRNLLLNWLILVPLLVMVILGVKLLVAGFWALPASTTTVALLGLFAIGSIGFATVDSLQQRPGWELTPSDVSRFEKFEMLPMAIGVLLASCATLKFIELPSSSPSVLATMMKPPSILLTNLMLGLIGASINLTAWMVVFMLAKPSDRTPSTRATIQTGKVRHALLSATGFTLGGSLTGWGLGAVAYLIIRLPGLDVANVAMIAQDDLQALLLICIGPILVVAASFAGEVIYVGFASYAPWGEAEREWLARAASFHFRVGGAWALGSLLIFMGSFAIFHLEQWTISWIASVGGFTGALSVIIAKASWSGTRLKEQYESWKNKSANVVLAIVTPIFIVIVVSFLSAAIDRLAGRQWLSFSIVSASNYRLWAWLIGIGLAMALIGGIASIAINTNRFSLHGMYRNRLIRAFLGASNFNRQSNGFTDFDDNDNIGFAKLWPNERVTGIPPSFLVCNCALNIVATEELAWQERKALSFTATPRSVGCGELNGGSGYYRSANDYGGGMTLGTAMTISGAAASPNMGYHTSTALSLLLTAFNVRLGAWLGNPGPSGSRTYRYAGPFFAMKPLVLEALGQTTDESSYIYLSDGGHFENLGLYEMVRRRCHLIVVSDGGCDPECAFEDLGNAVRKIAIDQNVSIKFRALNIAARKEPPVEGTYFAVGDITYPEPGAKSGLLLYLKPGYHGSEPASVRSYAAANPAFPHESTADQWFGESRFEAYRALGNYVMDSVGADLPSAEMDIPQFIEAAAAKLSGKATDDCNSQLASKIGKFLTETLVPNT